MTKRGLLTLLALFLLFDMVLVISANEVVIAYHIRALIVFAIISPPFFFINIKLLMIVRRERRSTAQARKVSTIVKLRNISTGLLAVACFVLLSLAAYISIAIRFVEKPTSTNVRLSEYWAITVACMNSTFNFLIFYWRNKALRQEGMKILKLFQCHRPSVATP